MCVVLRFKIKKSFITLCVHDFIILHRVFELFDIQMSWIMTIVFKNCKNGNTSKNIPYK